MGTIVASTIIGNARRLLQDVNNSIQRWSDTTLLAALNEGQLAAALLSPVLTTTTISHTLVAGTYQHIPANGLRYLRLTRNLSVSDVPGRTITPVDFDAITASDTSWHSAVEAGVIYEAAADPVDLLAFYVNPPAVVGTKVSLLYSVIPAEVATVGAAINIPGHMSVALADYIVFRILSENNGDAPALARAELHYSYFVNQVFGRPTVTPPSKR